ncbi:hypothetical protein L1987_52633 [Smallanthus sonchifolius]|uniref:Uncharacterized protein n=1 Tax=Smallanthus sonchifolius TaxID=185202 RepID=A0ACB9EU99_9ASTR|nr:hypothetical protein L1987_52633 [Smallanthus sonchifolius]
MGSNDEHFLYAMQLVADTSFPMVLETVIKLKVLEAIAEAGPDAQLTAHEIVSRLLSLARKGSMNQGQFECMDSHLLPNTSFRMRMGHAIVEGGVAYEKVHGRHTFEYSTLDATRKEAFNNAMLNHTTIVMKEILECYNGFINLESIQHVGGDMFKEVPQGDAIFMKWILHNWSDDDCVKLLKNCYKALPVYGKVIIVEEILPFVSDTSSSTKLCTQLDVKMMAFLGGKELTEDEFVALAKGAGFIGITKKCFVCNHWVMELYK